MRPSGCKRPRRGPGLMAAPTVIVTMEVRAISGIASMEVLWHVLLQPVSQHLGDESWLRHMGEVAVACEDVYVGAWDC
jgi:hypothetical protein